MSSSRKSLVIFGVPFLAALLSFPMGKAFADSVTYTWVTDSISTGSAPTSASFQVDLATVQTGTFGQLDIQNIDFSFPGLSLNFGIASSIGFDAAAFVDTTTGLPTFNDKQQGLAVIEYPSVSDFFDPGYPFLAILFDNPVGSSVQDQYNAINPASLGFGHGHWIESGYTPVTSVPLPAALPLFASGLAGLGWLSRRRRKQLAA